MAATTYADRARRLLTERRLRDDDEFPPAPLISLSSHAGTAGVMPSCHDKGCELSEGSEKRRATGDADGWDRTVDASYSPVLRGPRAGCARPRVYPESAGPSATPPVYRASSRMPMSSYRTCERE